MYRDAKVYKQKYIFFGSKYLVKICSNNAGLYQYTYKEESVLLPSRSNLHPAGAGFFPLFTTVKNVNQSHPTSGGR
jgi:hypothetical protein